MAACCVSLLVKCQSSYPSEVSPSLTPGYFHPFWASLVRLGCDKFLENGFIGNGDVWKWTEAGFLLNVRRKSNQEPACMGLKRKQQQPLPLWPPGWTQTLPSHLPYHTGAGRQKLSHAHLARVLRLWLLWKICMITCGVVWCLCLLLRLYH